MPTPSKYWREIPQRYRLEAGRCTKCETSFSRPGSSVPGAATEIREDTLARNGNVLTFTIIRVAPHQFSDQAPYAVGVVELGDDVTSRRRSSTAIPRKSRSG